jgi:hypothetical protein
MNDMKLPDDIPKKRGSIKLPDDMKLPDQDTAIQFAAHILARIDDDNVIVGPLVFERERDPGSLLFLVERSETGHGWSWNILEASREMAPWLRDCLIAELGKRRSLIIHDMDSELAAAKLAASLWPNPRIEWIVRELEERLREGPRLN